MTMGNDGESSMIRHKKCPGRHTRYAATTRKARPNVARRECRIEADGTSALQGSFVATEQWVGRSVAVGCCCGSKNKIDCRRKTSTSLGVRIMYVAFTTLE